MAIHLAGLVGGELHPVDDAIVVQLVGDQHRLGRGEAEEDARHRRVGGSGDHRSRAAVKLGQRDFQLHMRLVGAADEPDGAGPDAVCLGSLLFRLDQLAAQGKAEIGVRVHPDELAVAEIFQQEAGAASGLRRLHRDHDLLVGLGGAGGFEVSELRLQILEELVQRHGSLSASSAACRRPSRRGRSVAPTSIPRALRCRRPIPARNPRWPAAGDRRRTRCGRRESAS